MVERSRPSDNRTQYFARASTLCLVLFFSCAPTMKIAILGATGGTGVQLVKQALAAKYEVTAIVRNPANLKEIENSRLKVNQQVLFNFLINFTRMNVFLGCADCHR